MGNVGYGSEASFEELASKTENDAPAQDAQKVETPAADAKASVETTEQTE